MEDYISVEYNDRKRPQTSYPAKLAKYLFTRFKMQAGQTILEVGSGRCELLEHFKSLGLETYAIKQAQVLNFTIFHQKILKYYLMGKNSILFFLKALLSI